MLFDNFPFSNFHELNMDWFIKAMEAVKTEIGLVVDMVNNKQDKLPDGSEGQVLTLRGGKPRWRPLPESVTIQQVINTIYPIGSVYVTSDDRDPAAIFPGTTWIEIKDRFILASGDEHEVLEEGGHEQISLTAAQMPNHMHTYTAVHYQFDGAQTWGVQAGLDKSSTWNVNTNGSGAPVDIMPPYITFNVWRRTA